MIERGRTGRWPRMAVAVIFLVTGLGWFGMAVLAWNDPNGPKSSAVPWVLGGMVFGLTAIGVIARARWARLLGVVLGVGGLVAALGIAAASLNFLGLDWRLIGIMSVIVAAFAYVVGVLARRW